MDSELLLSPSQMGELDRRTIEELGVPGLVLMESAAGACAALILERYGARVGRGVVVLCGPGNNGGDGLAIGRRLKVQGVSVDLVLLQPEPGLSGDAAAQLDMVRRMAMQPEILNPSDPALPPEFQQDWHERGLIVDALFGTGLCRPVAGLAAQLVTAIETARAAGVPVLSVDIPSGVHGGSGQPQGVAVAADVTVSFASAKTGHYQEPGRGLRGDLVVADIGIPTHHWPEVTSQATRLLSKDTLRQAMPAGPAAAHKGTFGHVLVVAGSPGKCGAARLCAEAALRGGAGLVTLAIPEGLPLDSLQDLRPEVMVERVPGAADGSFSANSCQRLLELCAERDALAVGPGLGRSEGTRALVAELFTEAPCPAVFDADALNCLAELEATQARSSFPRILTPHPGELRRLLGRTESEPVTERLDAARELAGRYDAVAVLKGAATVVAQPDGRCRLNPTGNEGMATGGSGDVLTGVIAALLGRGLDAVTAASAGVYWHGLAGDLAAERCGTPSLLAGDIAACLAGAWQEAQRSQ